MLRKLSSLLFCLLCLARLLRADTPLTAFDLKKLERDRILKAADEYLKQEPVTVIASSCTRSAGGPQDFFSEGDYWWPDPKNPDGPYIQRDGMTNPDNFVAHRHAMVRLSEILGTMG